MDNIEIKKDLYVQLSFTLFGHLVGFHKEKKTLIAKSMSFVVDTEGDFYLLSKITDVLNMMNYEEEILFTVIKEGKSVSDMWDIQVRGTMHSISIEDHESIDKVKTLFELKSPYLGSIGFLDLGTEYQLFKLSVDSIAFQNLKQEREGKNTFLLSE